MTQPTLNMTNKCLAKSSYEQASTITATTATEQLVDTEQAAEPSDRSRDVAAVTLTKAELLDLFIVPVTSIMTENHLDRFDKENCLDNRLSILSHVPRYLMISFSAILLLL